MGRKKKSEIAAETQLDQDKTEENPTETLNPNDSEVNPQGVESVESVVMNYGESIQMDNEVERKVERMDTFTGNIVMESEERKREAYVSALEGIAENTAKLQKNREIAEKFRRNFLGLYDHIEYKFKEDGRIDWQAMIPEKFIVANKRNFEARNQEIPTEVSEIEEKDRLVLLGGIKYIAELRGFKSLKRTLVSPSDNYVAATCEIEFLPNFENPSGLTMTGEGDCNANYEKTFIGQVIATIAGNRSFIRAVRHALGITVYGQDEMASMDSPSNKEQHANNKVYGTLKDLCNKHNISFDGLKTALAKKGNPEAEKYKEIKDIPIDQCTLAISLIKKKYEK